MDVNSPLDLINRRFNSLRNSEKKVAELVQTNFEQIIMLSLQGLAEKCSVSDATVLRFCRSLGYRGYQDFKAALVPELLRQGYRVHRVVDQPNGREAIVESYRLDFQKQLDSTLNNCDYEIIKQVSGQIATANKTLIIGLGGSAGVGHILCDSLGSLGIYSTFMSDRSISQSLVPLVSAGDVVVGISHSGETDEVVSALAVAHDYGAHTIGITNFSPSPLADIADITLITSVSDNLLGGYSCQARMSQLALLELVLYELSEMLVISRNDVAKAK